LTAIQRLLSAGIPFSERDVYLRSWGSRGARLNESTEALSSGSLPMLPLFENYSAQFATFEYQLGEMCFKRSDDEILELFAFLDRHSARQRTFHKFGTDCDKLFHS
jgi:hypothetical protein